MANAAFVPGAQSIAGIVGDNQLEVFPAKTGQPHLLFNTSTTGAFRVLGVAGAMGTTYVTQLSTHQVSLRVGLFGVCDSEHAAAFDTSCVG